MNNKNSPKGEYQLIHNPGDNFRELVYWTNDPEKQIAPYFVPVLALLGACFSIEGYVNMVGQKIDPNWNKFDKGFNPLKDRLGRIYSQMDKELDYSQGIWKKVLKLFKTRIQLVHPRYRNHKERRIDDIPDIFDTIEKEYPPVESKDILEKAIDTLLNDTELIYLKGIGRMQGYSGPIRGL